MALALKALYGEEGFAVLLWLANAAVPPIQGIAVFELALTICLASIMSSFVRRISTLLGDHPSNDLDPDRSGARHVTRRLPLAQGRLKRRISVTAGFTL